MHVIQLDLIKICYELGRIKIVDIIKFWDVEYSNNFELDPNVNLKDGY